MRSFKNCISNTNGFICDSLSYLNSISRGQSILVTLKCILCLPPPHHIQQNISCHRRCHTYICVLEYTFNALSRIENGNIYLQICVRPANPAHLIVPIQFYKIPHICHIYTEQKKSPFLWRSIQYLVHLPLFSGILCRAYVKVPPYLSCIPMKNALRRLMIQNNKHPKKLE